VSYFICHMNFIHVTNVFFSVTGTDNANDV
jgi:hypothetical protein